MAVQRFHSAVPKCLVYFFRWLESNLLLIAVYSIHQTTWVSVIPSELRTERGEIPRGHIVVVPVSAADPHHIISRASIFFWEEEEEEQSMHVSKVSRRKKANVLQYE
ncbi:hypothetical protein ONS95_001018 [Cadophora gregata]|uniref:uncharacterized protein n=1 Tax=Cadophora gregata TaxID=51156 RepID=UPI0026DB4AE7|nr:uncharacterized protein ONS95_001018 [Cadophora gregata]KAK0129077.1 hypothetical protein ONS95_001018 [Cadophora gregata]